MRRETAIGAIALLIAMLIVGLGAPAWAEVLLEMEAKGEAESEGVQGFSLLAPPKNPRRGAPLLILLQTQPATSGGVGDGR